MRLGWMLTVTMFGAALLFTSSSALAGQDEAMRAPGCKKNMQWDDKFGNGGDLKEGSTVHSLCKSECKAGGGLLTCKPGVEALRGTIDPKHAEAATDLLYSFKDKEPNSLCVWGKCRMQNKHLGPVIFQSPNAAEALTGLIDTPEKLGGVACGIKADIARGLWYLADTATLDTLIASWDNTVCSGDHAKNLLPVIHLWNPSDAQRTAIEAYCVDKVLPGPWQDDMRNGKDVTQACYRYLAATGSDNDDGIEYVRQGSDNDIEALRALAILDAKGSKKGFAKALKKEMSNKNVWVKTKKEEKKVKMDTWRGTEKSVTVALGLGYKHKEAKQAIDWWLSYNSSWEKVNDSAGWEHLFLSAPFFPRDKKLFKAMEKAYANIAAIAEDNEKVEEAALRAAIGLAQMGSAKGLPTLEEAIKGTDASRRKETLEGLGGVTYYWGSFRVGAGGVKVGGKEGLKRSHVEGLIKLILKKHKFMGQSEQEAASLAILDMRARMKVAGI